LALDLSQFFFQAVPLLGIIGRGSQLKRNLQLPDDNRRASKPLGLFFRHKG
jgi:hypothetical protein